ncbi:MAG: hypothetical protein QXI91_02295 [Candidatus Bathyarchaeia archaeon]
MIETKNEKIDAKLKIVGGDALNFENIIKKRDALQTLDTSGTANN